MANYTACANFSELCRFVSPNQWNWNNGNGVSYPDPVRPVLQHKSGERNLSGWSNTKVYHPLLGGIGSTGGTERRLAGFHRPDQDCQRRTRATGSYYTGNLRSLSGTATVVNGSATSNAVDGEPDLLVNQPVVSRRSHPVIYRVAAATTGTDFTLTAPYTGTYANGIRLRLSTAAAIELVSVNPHGLRTGDLIATPGVSTAIGPRWISITGGYGTQLSGGRSRTAATP